MLVPLHRPPTDPTINPRINFLIRGFMGIVKKRFPILGALAPLKVLYSLTLDAIASIAGAIAT